MITTMIQSVDGFDSRCYQGDSAVDPYASVDIMAGGHRATVFYDSPEMLRRHSALLADMARKLDEHQKTKGVE